MSVCSQGHTVPPGSAFCGECGDDLQPRCAQGHRGSVGDHFCDTCGSPLRVASVDRQDSTPLALQAEPVPAPSTAATAVLGGDVPTPQSQGGLLSASPPAPAYPPPAPVRSTTTPRAPEPPREGHWPAGSGGGALPTSPSPAPFEFDLHRLSRVDQITGSAALVALVSLFLPWFGISGGGVSYSTSGLKTHTFLVFAFLAAVVLLAYLLARAGWDRLPVRLAIAHAPLLLVLGGVLLLLVLLGFLLEPDGLSRQAGAWIALLASLGATLPVGIPAVQSMRTAPR